MNISHMSDRPHPGSFSLDSYGMWRAGVTLPAANSVSHSFIHCSSARSDSVQVVAGQLMQVKSVVHVNE